MPVIPTTVPPAAALLRDSARVEKRGPWITIIVPPSTTCIAGSGSALTAWRPWGQ